MEGDAKPRASERNVGVVLAEFPNPGSASVPERSRHVGERVVGVRGGGKSDRADARWEAGDAQTPVLGWVVSRISKQL